MQLVIIDTAQIQSYIFGSNRLKENIGASHLVWLATKQWAFEELPKPHNMIKPLREFDDWEFADSKIEDPNQDLAAEVLYAGGGNVVVLFREKKDADWFERRLSCKVLKDAPGLQLVIVSKDFEWKNQLRPSVIDLFRNKLPEEKRKRTLTAPLLGLGPTRRCQSTGLPAVRLVKERGDLEDVEEAKESDREKLAVSAETYAKLKNVRPANARLRDIFKNLLKSKYEFPYQLDHLGRAKGEHSYIAVIHADGDGMGKRIEEIGSGLGDDNRAYIAALRGFSNSLQEAAREAFKETVKKLVHFVEHNKKEEEEERIVLEIVFKLQGEEILSFELEKLPPNKWLLPFRPLIFGGDDVTFVCNGPLGLSLAIEFMRLFESKTKNLPDQKGRATSSTGVAIIKVHYPFSRAYTLADGLCKKAKSYRREKDLKVSCLDWHFALSGLAGDIDEIRRREYTTPEGSLTLRPVTLGMNEAEKQRTWQVIDKGVQAFRSGDWKDRKNKLNALQTALRKGAQEAAWFLQKFNDGNPLPDVEPSLADMKTTGWQGGYCGYFDALELVDWFIPLDGEE